MRFNKRMPPRSLFRFAIVVGLGIAAVGCGAAAKQDALTPKQQLQDPQILIARGKAYAEIGDYVRAEQYFAAAIAAGGEQKEVLPPLLKACVASGNVRLASEYAESALANSPNDGHLRFLTGALHASVGNKLAAKTHLVRAATDLPKDPDVQFAVATFFRDSMADRVEADPYFREYLKLAPGGQHAEEARASLMEQVRTTSSIINLTPATSAPVTVGNPNGMVLSK